MIVAVIGLGYVGLPLATLAANAGHRVIGIDSSQELIDALQSGVSHVETTTGQDLEFAVSKGMVLSTQIADIAQADVVVICVPTPLDENRGPDLTMLEAATDGVARNVKADALVINESTSYPGTLRDAIAPVISAKQPNVLFASAPERIDPGSRTHGVTNTPRVVGGLTAQATDKAQEFYSSLGIPTIAVASPEVAETSKLFENTFRQVNIALVNELAQICSALNIPVWDVLDAAGTKPFGFMKFRPSAGVGGHCIPVDPAYLSWRAQQAGQSTRFINLANEVNANMPLYVSQRVQGKVPAGSRIVVVGVAYKPDVADVRETPALALIDDLRAQGYTVDWHDPLVQQWRGETSTSDLNADAFVVVTAHQSVDWAAIKAAQSLIFDTTGVLRGEDGVVLL